MANCLFTAFEHLYITAIVIEIFSEYSSLLNKYYYSLLINYTVHRA